MKFKGYFLIFCVLLAGVYTASQGFLSYMTLALPVTNEGVIPFLDTESVAESEAVTNETDDKSNKTNTSSKNETATSKPASTDGQAIGVVTEKFISPYTANTKYNKVYVKNNIGTKINLSSLLQKKSSFKIQKNGKPQVLIMHTHTTESFMMEDRDYYTKDDAARSRDKNKNMIAVGNVFEEELTAAGIGVIHDTTVHDYPAYTGSYTRSAATVKADLKAYPSIKVVIDIHRDSITGNNKEKVRPVVKIDGNNAAQVMLVMGSQTGGITGYPNWKENLSFALKYQQKLEVAYPGLARALTLNSGKYNQNLTVGSILLEVGTEVNTLDEAKRGAKYAAKALVSLLNTMK